MSTFKIQLRDGTMHQLADGNIGSQFSIICPDKATYLSVWDTMTNENLTEVTVFVDDGILTVMRNIILDGTQAIYSPSGTIMGLFYFHGAEYEHVDPISPEDSEYIEVAKILLGEEV